MYAIIVDGGHQYKVEEGQSLEIDFREVEPGTEITFDRVLAVSDGENFRLGQPLVAGAKVTAKVVGETIDEAGNHPPAVARLRLERVGNGEHGIRDAELRPRGARSRPGPGRRSR